MSSSLPPEDEPYQTWSIVEDVEIRTTKILGKDKDEPELTVVFVEYEISISRGRSWDDDEEVEPESSDWEVCVWIDEEGDVCDWEEGDEDSVEIL